MEQASPQLRCYEVEQAAHALRHRLALASNHKRSPIPPFIASFNGKAENTSQRQSSQPSQSSTSPESEHTPQPIASPASMQGLGIGLASGMDEDRQSQCEDVMMKEELDQASSLQSHASSEKESQNCKPSLYDVIFGSTFGRVAMPGVKASTKSSSSPPVVQQRSPHVRQGSSAFLEQVALSPQHNMLSNSTFITSEYPPSPRNFSQEFTPQLSSLTSPSRHWGSQAESTIFDTPSDPMEQDSYHSTTTPFGSLKHRTPKLGSSKHRRMRSSGGSVLPNGHPASSLAQDLGIATGGVRPARSRNASAAGRLIGGFNSHPNRYDREDLRDEHTSTKDTSMLAGFLLASLSSGSNDNEEAKVSPPRSSKFVDPNTLTPRRRQRNSVGDLHTPTSTRFNTPSSAHRRQSLANHHLQQNSPINEVDEAGNNEAAHSLLDLASSPSPSPSQFRSSSHLPGHTPSLRDDLIAYRRKEHGKTPSLASPMRSGGTVKYKLMDDIDRHEERGRLSDLRGILKTPSNHANNSRAGRGHARTGSLGSHGITDGGSPIRSSFKSKLQNAPLLESAQPTTPPSGLYDLSPSPRKHARTPSQAGRVRLMSPPMTPPHSDEVTTTGKTEQAARSDAMSHRGKRSTSPLSPLDPHPSLREADVEMQSSEEDKVSQDVPAEEKSTSVAHGELPIQTPRTPPPLPNTPRTPKAPGSNFSYGDFLHVSPSPQPKMRGMYSGLGTPNSSKLPSAAGVLGHSLDQTPTRATRSRAKFLDFDQSGSGKAVLKQMAMSNDDHHQYRNQHDAGVDGLGLGGAFDADEPEQMLIPGKRIATTPKSNPNDIGKRFRIAQM
ncbi:uncharacterized protein FA14DRAFT_34610 [Meira miltonrushii]|uniref:Uncharacterized protein n=1 Tax=Meira miltonrushii TaxID=1280837 RepID=A0A316VBD6_9BASI|nr:uncharacterized protein FA14DRAFT_34610 [Meira miltonrushii]PWN34826.1 hypothetical protein FA14DRAFT_34610 [Meira miltonrushii]